MQTFDRPAIKAEAKRLFYANRSLCISMALLVFLVCAIISGVVIVAATAVGGRASGLREADEAGVRGEA